MAPVSGQLEQLLASKPDSIEQLLDGITPEIHLKLKSAIELGKWENGVSLNSAQREHCLQAVILYEAKHLPETNRTGFGFPRGCKNDQPKPELVASRLSMRDLK